MTVAADTVAANLAVVRRRIADAGGDPGAITLVAVTKGFDRIAVDAALAAGVVDIGENYAQELRAKAEAPVATTAPTPRWHFVGRLQRNKVRTVAHLVACWQSVDRVEVGAEIAARAPGARVLVQVNVSGEPAKGGTPAEETGSLVTALRDLGLDVAGLMAIGPAGPPEAARPGFARLRRLADDLDLRERSMGMTADLEVAVAEGATMVRVGSALFGPRDPRAGGAGM